jgi:hypothetical protein
VIQRVIYLHVSQDLALISLDILVDFGSGILIFGRVGRNIPVNLKDQIMGKNVERVKKSVPTDLSVQLPSFDILILQGCLRTFCFLRSRIRRILA